MIKGDGKALHFRIDDGEGILGDTLEDDGLFRDDVSSVTPGLGNPQLTTFCIFACIMDPFEVCAQD